MGEIFSVGKDGVDIINGGSDTDIFFFAEGDGQDCITNFEIGVDTIDLSAHPDFTVFDDVATALSDTAEGVLLTAGPNDAILFAGILASDLTEDDFLLV